MDTGTSTKPRMCIEATNEIYVAQTAEPMWTREKAAFLIKGYFEDEFRYYVDYNEADKEALRKVINMEKALAISGREEWEPIEWVRFALGRGIDVPPQLLKFFPNERSIFEEVEALRSEIDLLKRSGPFVSEKLAKVNVASRKFWAGVDQNDRAAHPINKDVAKWLVEQGIEETPAKHAASLIRPEWASIGRKPKE